MSEIDISHKLLRGDYLRQAITVALEVIAREEIFKLEDAEKRTAMRVRRNATRDRYKFIKDPDILAMIRIGRICNLIPEYSANLRIKQ